MRTGTASSCLAGVVVSLVTGVTQAEPCLTISYRQPLPSALEWVADVRWADAESVFVAAQRIGVHRLTLRGPAVAELIEPRSNARNGVWLPKILGASKDYFAVAAPVYAYGWKPRTRNGLEAVQPFATIIDLDVHGSRIALLGAQRDDQDRFAPDGAIAWTGPIDQDPEKLQPVYYTVSGPGAPNVNACGLMEIGSIRFLADGSLLVLPGVEPDVHRFSTEGRLQETWSSEKIGFKAECDLTEEQISKLSVDEPGRWAWVNARRTVDEILPLADAPGLLVRTAEAGKTSWQLKRLRSGGAVDTCDVPLTVDSELAHLRGDVRGDEVVLLLLYRGYTQKTPHPPAHPELIRLTYQPP